MRMLNNQVLIAPDYDTGELLLQGGGKINLVTMFEEFKHAIQCGTVIAVPDRIHFTRRNVTRSSEFDTDMEVQVGDKVIFHYLVAGEVKRRKKYLFNENLWYMDYDKLMLAVRDGEIIPLNGRVIVEALEDKDDLGSLIATDRNSRVSATRAVVRYVSRPLRGYLFRKDVTYSEDYESVVPGAVVTFNKAYARRMRDDLHMDIGDGKTLYWAFHYNFDSVTV